MMTGLEALPSVQFVTVEGRRFAVVEGGDWESLMEWLEQLEDVQAARSAYQRFGGRKRQMSPEKVQAASTLMTNQRLSIPEICKVLGISRSTLYRYVGTHTDRLVSRGPLLSHA